MKVYELTPIEGQGRKSFYGKARVTVHDDGTEVLRSYETEVMRKNPDGTLVKLYDKWTATTGAHIKAFCGLDKKAWKEL